MIIGGTIIPILKTVSIRGNIPSFSDLRFRASGFWGLGPQGLGLQGFRVQGFRALGFRASGF